METGESWTKPTPEEARQLLASADTEDHATANHPVPIWYYPVIALVLFVIFALNSIDEPAGFIRVVTGVLVLVLASGIWRRRVGVEIQCKSTRLQGNPYFMGSNHRYNARGCEFPDRSNRAGRHPGLVGLDRSRCSPCRLGAGHRNSVSAQEPQWLKRNLTHSSIRRKS